MVHGSAETREQPFPDCQLNQKEEKAERAKKRKNEGRRGQEEEGEERLVNMQGREVEVRDDASSVKKEREKKLTSEGKCKLSRPSVSPHRTQTCK